MDQVIESTNVIPGSLTVDNNPGATLSEANILSDGTKLYSFGEFDKNVLQKDFMKLFDKYIARGVLFDKVNNVITIIYIDAMATMYSIKYYDSYVERHRHTLLKEIVELNSGSYPPNYKLIVSMLRRFSMYFDTVWNAGNVGNKLHFNEYSIGNLYQHIPYLNTKDINNLVSTNITNVHVLDNTLLRVYDLFREHGNQDGDKYIVQLTKERDATKSTADSFQKLYDDAIKEHHKIRDQCMDENRHHIRLINEKLSASEQSYLDMKNSNKQLLDRETVLLSKVQDLTTDNEQLRQTVSRLQTHMIAAINTLDSLRPSSDKE